jgi:hypothetical protein
MKRDAMNMNHTAHKQSSSPYRPGQRFTNRAKRTVSIVSAICFCGLTAGVSIAGGDDAAAPAASAPAYNGAAAPSADAAASPAAPGSDATTQPTGEDLRTAIGVNPNGPKAVDVPEVPEMSVVGFVQPHDRPAMALLELADKRGSDLKRIYLVKVGTEIPVTISGRVNPVGHNELTGLSDAARPAPIRSDDDSGQETQIILTVTKVTQDGVTVKAGLLSKTIVVH